MRHRTQQAFRPFRMLAGSIPRCRFIENNLHDFRGRTNFKAVSVAENETTLTSFSPAVLPAKMTSDKLTTATWHPGSELLSSRLRMQDLLAPGRCVLSQFESKFASQTIQAEASVFDSNLRCVHLRLKFFSSVFIRVHSCPFAVYPSRWRSSAIPTITCAVFTVGLHSTLTRIGLPRRTLHYEEAAYRPFH